MFFRRRGRCRRRAVNCWPYNNFFSLWHNSIAESLGMLHPDHMSAAGLPLTVRTVYIISPEKVLKLALTYPASTGRNFDEVGGGFDGIFCSHV